jgi:hypothetical protein
MATESVHDSASEAEDDSTLEGPEEEPAALLQRFKNDVRTITKLTKAQMEKIVVQEIVSADDLAQLNDASIDALFQTDKVLKTVPLMPILK